MIKLFTIGSYAADEIVANRSFAAFGFSERQVRDINESTVNDIPFPEDSQVSVCRSTIQGRGVFSSINYKQDDFIAPMQLNGKRTPAGRFCNHSYSPNARAVLLINCDVILSSLTDIKAGDEIVIHYGDFLAQHFDMAEQLARTREN